MSGPILRANSLTRNFTVSEGLMRAKKTVKAVNGVNLQIGRGEVLAVVGESGCGNTTLVKMLLGLLPPTSGSIELGGKQLTNISQKEISRLVQPVFQDPYSSLNPRKTIGAIITLPLLVQSDHDRSSWHRRVEEMMELVGLPKRFYHNYPNQLSGGQRQRVAIARALINRPEIVICDEPTSALDVSVQSQILNLLQELRNELDLTYFIISHNLAVVEHIATNVAVMYLGRIVETAETGELFEHPKHPYPKKPDECDPTTRCGARSSALCCWH